MLFIVEPIMGTVNAALNNGLASMGGSSKLILGMILGGMMAIDMGGPFNKAAYVFGTAAIAAGNYDIMASVMIGGMVPPCAIALATLLFKDKFTKEERESGPTNFIMGLAFITEGAIPFAAADPIHVLPACIIGSGLAGALHGIWLYLNGTARRHLRCTGYGKCAALSGGTCHRNSGIRSSAWSFKEKSCIKE